MDLLLAWDRQHQQDEQHALVESDWDDMDVAEFLALCGQSVTSPQQFVIPPKPFVQPSGTQLSTNPDVIFKKGIYQDLQAFPMLKDICFFSRGTGSS